MDVTPAPSPGAEDERLTGSMMGDYRDAYSASRKDPDAFRHAAADAVTWSRRPRRGLDAGRAPFYRWFPDGELNTCYNALDRHVDAGHGDRPPCSTTRR
ncbi:acetyl-coenzyme A synthetase N-terminal domain-containing protein [Microbispora rosea]|uniref:acetyl-coenzyme A synthetase N-terminal domain-containing protein n=2 Tax=Microbispora rosea TaxID=58117 RepID=UPI003448B5B1